MSARNYILFPKRLPFDFLNEINAYNILNLMKIKKGIDLACLLNSGTAIALISANKKILRINNLPDILVNNQRREKREANLRRNSRLY